MSTNLVTPLLIIGLLFFCYGCNSSAKPDTLATPFYTFQGSESEVKAFASKYSGALMRQFNPQTGYNPYYRINDWSYDADSNMYAIDLTAWWTGKPNVFADECESELTVVYHVARDGSSFAVEEPQTNACIQAGQNSDNFWDAFVEEMKK